MIVQTIEISLSKGRAPDLLAHVAESGREIEMIPDIELSADDYTAEIDTVKPDGTFTMTNCTIDADGHIIAPIIEQAVAVKGLCHYIIKIYNNDVVIYSACGSLWVDDHLITDGMIESIAEVNGYRFPQDFFTIHDIEANPDAVTTEILEKLRVFDTIYAISGYSPSKTKNGNPVEFTDGADAPLVKCETAITGYQQGSGTPSPDNIRPIVAYTEGEIEVIDGDGNVTTHTTTFSNSIYQGNADFVGGSVECEMPVIDLGDLNWTYDSSGQRFYTTDISSLIVASNHYDNTKLKCSCFETSNDPISGDGDASICYVAGHLNRLYARWKAYTSAADFTTAVTGQKMTFDLATPSIEQVSVSNTPIKSLYGYNHIESTTGDLNIEYITDIFQPLVKSIEQLI